MKKRKRKHKARKLDADHRACMRAAESTLVNSVYSVALLECQKVSQSVTMESACRKRRLRLYTASIIFSLPLSHLKLLHFTPATL